MVDRYGPAIEYDLHALLGLDLVAWFRGEYPWAKLVRLVDQLPQGSATWAARLDDDEMAAEYVRKHPERPVEKQRASLRDHTRTNQLLAATVDAVATLIHRMDSVFSDHPGTPQHLPRPETAVERAYRTAEVEELDSLVALAETAIQRAEGT